MRGFQSSQERKTFTPWADPNATPLVRFEAVTKRFGSFMALDNVSLDIYEREFFALLGPSGCGKTTLLRLLAGFETPTEGRLTLNGEDITHVPPYKRPINMMFQSYALFPHMTVEKNIAFGLKQDRMSKKAIADRVEEMLALVQLEAFAGRKPHQLSGGQRQRVALARSLAKKPHILLLDEPLAALDKKLRARTQFELMNIQETLGLTFVIVTHDQEEAMTVSDRIAVMDHGRTIQVAAPEEIYEYPNCRYVADFVGEINLIEGRISTLEDGMIRLAWDENQPEIRAVAPEGSSRAASAWIAIRPEKIRISKERPQDATVNTVKGQVWDIGYLGNTSTYHVRLDNGLVIRAQEPNLSHLIDRSITWEDVVWLHWPADAGVVLLK